jgi:outer membrane protein TolC
LTLAAATSLARGQAPPGETRGAGAGLGLLEAVRLTLEQDPSIKVQELQTHVAGGVLQEASGQFDVVLETALQRGLTRQPRTELERFTVGSTNLARPNLARVLVEDVTSYRLGASKQLRFGPALSTGVELTRFADNLGQRRAVNRANLNFVVNVPLLKGFGYGVADATERAARISYEAEVLDLHHLITARLLNTASAYWDCLAAQAQTNILHNTRTNAEYLVTAVKALIDAGEVAEAELQQVQADYAQKTAALIAGQQRLTRAQQDLAVAIGRPVEQLPVPLVATDSFPLPVAQAAAPPFNGQTQLEPCLARRADYQAALKVQQAADILWRAARHNLKPQLDLQLEVGYAGLDEGSQFRRFYGALDPRDLVGLNTMGTLRLQWPIENNAARGLFVQREAAAQQSAIRAQDAARRISSGILVALDELQRAIEELGKATEAARYYEQAKDNERRKLEIGSSTVIDVITVADRWSSARLDEVAAQARYATALARVRFETGLLVSLATAPRGVLNLEDLITIPTADLLESRPRKP